jgi:2'-5' RNA ligase
MRLFLAVNLPEGVRRELYRRSRVIREAAPSVAWVRADLLHFTVRFLGEVSEEGLAPLLDEVGRAVATRRVFDVELSGVGAFPSMDVPRVIWAGVAQGGELRALASAVEGALQQLGFEGESKEFVPHLTLGRVKRPLPASERRALASAAREFKAYLGVRVTHVDLMKSVLRPDGPQYTLLHNFLLER